MGSGGADQCLRTIFTVLAALARAFNEAGHPSMQVAAAEFAPRLAEVEIGKQRTDGFTEYSVYLFRDCLGSGDSSENIAVLGQR
jgi:hypothetical protein